MSRKARETAAAASWAPPKLWAGAATHSFPKLGAFFGDAARGAVVILHLPEHDEPHALLGLAQIGQRALLSHAALAPPALIVLDLTPLVAAGLDLPAAMDAEGRSAALGHLGKPASRALCKLLGSGMAHVTLVARGGAAQLALKLLGATADERALRALDRLLLLHPRLPAACVNARLGAAPPAGDAPLAALRVDVVFESEAARERRLPAIRARFADGADAVAGGHGAAVLSHALLAPLREAAEAPPLEAYDAARLDAHGRRLWLCELVFALSRQTKQQEAAVVSAASAYEQVARTATATPPPPPPPPTTTTTTTTTHAAEQTAAPPDAASVASVGGGGVEVGALVLRGSRCVLVRSLSGAWRGMRIPSVRAREGEAPHQTAIRAAAELCDIDGATEVLPLPAIPPAVIFRADGQAIWVYALYAARPPPPGPLEDQDQSDQEDLYDWYTFPRAAAALSTDPASIGALRAMAYTLSSAAAAAVLPRKWGGVFGDEFVAAAAGGREASAAAPTAPAVAQLAGSLPFAELLECAAACAAAAAARHREACGGEARRAPPAAKFRAVRAFHPSRLRAALQQWAGVRPRLRIEGIAWLATQPNLQAVVRADGAGACVVEPGNPWWACIPRSKWPAGLEEEIAPLWHAPHGDRQSELSVEPVEPSDSAAVERCLAQLEGCLLTEAEGKLPLAALDDPFADAWAPVLLESAERERAERIADDVHGAFERARRPAKSRAEAGASADLDTSVCLPCN